MELQIIRKDKIDLTGSVTLNSLKEKKLKVAAYVRVSTEDEIQNFSFSSQYKHYYKEIEENPNSIIVFNNFDKSSRILHNLVDSMINNGYISNMNNEKVYLNNSIIFVCSNFFLKSFFLLISQLCQFSFCLF